MLNRNYGKILDAKKNERVKTTSPQKRRKRADQHRNSLNVLSLKSILHTLSLLKRINRDQKTHEELPPQRKIRKKDLKRTSPTVLRTLAVKLLLVKK